MNNANRMAIVACTASGAMFVGSQARLVVGVWHALGGMGLWQCWFLLEGGGLHIYFGGFLGPSAVWQLVVGP